MKANNHLSVLVALIVGFPLFLNAEISQADRLVNEHIKSNIPVYDASHLSVTTLREGGVFDTHMVGYISVELENPIILEPKPVSTSKRKFMGYSGKDSQLQLYTKPAVLSSLTSEGQTFGDPIPLVPGEYIIKSKAPSLGKYNVALTISLTTWNIKIVKSGWLILPARYEEAPIYLVEIKKVEKL